MQRSGILCEQTKIVTFFKVKHLKQTPNLLVICAMLVFGIAERLHMNNVAHVMKFIAQLMVYFS